MEMEIKNSHSLELSAADTPPTETERCEGDELNGNGTN